MRSIQTKQLGLFGRLVLMVMCLLLSRSMAWAQGGQVWSWGWNVYGQLGNGTGTPSAIPISVTGMTGVIAISGGFHSLALKSDGTVWAWGNNNHGQLGNGTFNPDYPYRVPNPAVVLGLNDVAAIACGAWHSLALKSNGSVWAWGGNGKGQLGNGAFSTSPPYGIVVPVPVSGLSGVVAIAGKSDQSLALKSDGTVWAWGENRYGQLGNGTFNPSPPYGVANPALVTGLNGVVAIASGSGFSLALKSDGTVWAWGDNSVGQLGNGTYTNNAPYGIAIPAQINGLNGVAAIASGSIHSLALTGIPTAFVSGTIALEGIVPNAVPQPLTLTFRPADNSGNIIKTVSVNPNGVFAVSGLPRKAYTLHIKGSKWLARNVAVNASNGNVSGVNAILPSGDANNDNVVDIADLLILIGHYNAVFPDARYLEAADFNSDAVNSISDLLLLIGNYNQLGNS